MIFVYVSRGRPARNVNLFSEGPPLPLTLKCPKCSAHTVVPREYAEAKIPCSGCQVKLLVRRPAPAHVAPPQEDVPDAVLLEANPALPELQTEPIIDLPVDSLEEVPTPPEPVRSAHAGAGRAPALRRTTAPIS